MDCKELSQSSGISLADISINSNLCDSELEDEDDTVLESNKSYELTGRFQSLGSRVSQASENTCGTYTSNVSHSQMTDFATSFHHESGQLLKYSTPMESCNRERDTRPYIGAALGEKPLSTLIPLGDVRFALQENCNLLSDQNLLSDLLQSLDEKLAKTSRNGITSSSIPYRADNRPISSYVPPNKDPGPGLASAPTLTTTESSTNARPKDKSCELPTDIKMYGKRVTFDEMESGSGRLKNKDYTNNVLEVSRSHELLKQLSCLRWKLGGWEEEGLDPPTDEKTNVIFLYKMLHLLQVYQEQKKHLEERLVTTDRDLMRMTEEAEVTKKQNLKIQARMREADAQMEIIQREWLSAYEVNRHEVLTLQKDCNQLKKERDSLKEELAIVEKELQKYAELTKDYQTLKCTLEEAQSQFAASRRQTAEIAEENSRLSKNLQDKEKYLREVEEIKLVNVKRELEEASSRLENLETSYQKLMRTNAHLTDDLRMLHDQHKTLLQKVVLEEEQKEAALKEKEALEEHIKSITSKMSTAKVELHTVYQNQVKQLVRQKTENLQEQLHTLESSLQKNLSEQLDAQRDTHRHALTKIQEGHRQEVQDLCNTHSTTVARLQKQIQHLQEENHALKTQHQGIITAVSSILSPHPQAHNTQGTASHVLDFPWNGNMASTSTPINTRPVSPQNEKVTMGRGVASSKSGSRPTSGRIGRSNHARVPRLSHIDSSSCESDASVFQDGKQTVRCLVGGSMVNLGNSKGLDGRSKSENVGTAGTVAANDPVKMHCAEREYRSLPELQNRIEVLEKRPSFNTGMRGGMRGSSKGSVGLPLHQNHQAKEKSDSYEEMPPPAFRKIYRASEILKNDDEGMEDLPNLMHVDLEMARLIEELRSIKSSAKTSESEAPTHDTSFDQDPANITLRKLSQVSTLLSQYVNHAPTSQ